MNNERVILVAGATGQQGGAVARHLLGGGWKLRAMTRDPGKPSAQALVKAGVEVVQGNYQDRESLERALEGVYGAFSVQTPWGQDPIRGAENEERQGKTFADAAKAAGVQHLIYSSVGGAERNTGIPHFESKWHIEEHIRALGLPHTILRPVAFMENFGWSREQIFKGILPGFGLPPEKTLQLIAADDIGAFATMAFAQPREFLGKAIEIAGDELTEPQQAELFAKAIGHPVALGRFSLPGVAQMDQEMDPMMRFFRGQGYRADIPTLRKLYPGLRTLERWLEETGWATKGVSA